MVEALDAVVLKLVRVSIGSLRIGTLPIGHWRLLSAAELRQLTTPARGRTSQAASQR
jgi:23S rRNA pseudouridine2605 synthase